MGILYDVLIVYMIAGILSAFPPGLSALPVHEAGHISFTTSQGAAFLSSYSGNCTLGFRTVNGGDGYLLSIWHSGDPNKTAIWWPESNDTGPTVEAGASFNFTSAGTLELHSPQGTLLWSSNTTSSYAQLQDSGNLVLLDKNEKTVLWQSFDHNRNSLILVDLTEERLAKKSFLLQSTKNQSSYAPGSFHIATDAYLNVYFHALDALNNDFVYLYASIQIGNGFEIGRQYGNYFNVSSGNGTDVFGGQLRLTLDYDGNLRVYMWESNVSSWRAVWQMLDDVCMLGSPCGPFGICKQEGAGKNGVNCSCPPGYHMRAPGDASQGCESYVSFNASCTGGGSAISSSNNIYNTTMVEVPHSDYDYDDLSNQQNVLLDECKALCLNECACMAASYAVDQSKCYLKGNSTLGYLLNGYASDTNTLLIKVVQSLPSSNVAAKKRGHLWLVVAVPGGACVVLVAVSCALWFACRRRLVGAYTSWWLTRSRRQEIEATGEVGGPVKCFTYEELAVATGNFSEKLGEGGFGVVYKGWVKLLGTKGGNNNIGHQYIVEENIVTRNPSREEQQQLVAVAVKVLKVDEAAKGSGGGGAETQFRAEVWTLGRIHHVNLVSLVGYCIRPRRRTRAEDVLLVFEYMENGSVDRFLSPSQPAPLPWPTRYSIALGTARGIAYLHHECSPPIMHCDIKPHNILLDHDFTAKVADFGFAKRFHLHSHITMSGIRGTRGYLAPEWLTSQELTSKVDVFSYGMLLLELVRGFKTWDEAHASLLGWAIRCIVEGAVPDDGNDVPMPHHIAGSSSSSDILLMKEHNNNGALQSSGSTDDDQAAAEKLHVLKVGMWCIQNNPVLRPPMSRVVQLIEGTVPMEQDPPIPHAAADFVLPANFPAFAVQTDYSSSTAWTSSTRNFTYSVVSAR